MAYNRAGTGLKMAVIKIHEQWCKKQQEDYNKMLQLVDDLGAAALGLTTNGAQGYQQFVETRDSFKQTFKDISKNYRYVE